MDYHVHVTPSFKRDLKKLPRQVQSKIITCLEEMKADTRPSNVEKLSQAPEFLRKRIGHYRMIYTVDDGEQIVVVARVRHRREAYKDLGQLDARLLFEAVKRKIN